MKGVHMYKIPKGIEEGSIQEFLHTGPVFIRLRGINEDCFLGFFFFF
jgi:hypothetical protein